MPQPTVSWVRHVLRGKLADQFVDGLGFLPCPIRVPFKSSLQRSGGSGGVLVFKGDLDGTQQFVEIESFRPDIEVVLRQARFMPCKQPVATGQSSTGVVCVGARALIASSASQHSASWPGTRSTTTNFGRTRSTRPGEARQSEVVRTGRPSVSSRD